MRNIFYGIPPLHKHTVYWPSQMFWPSPVPVGCRAISHFWQVSKKAFYLLGVIIVLFTENEKVVLD